MAFKTASDVVTAARDFLGVDGSSNTYYADALLVRELNDAILQLQNVMDSVDSAGFMTGTISGALTTSESIAESSFLALINDTARVGIRDIRLIMPLSGSGLTHKLQKVSNQEFVQAALNPRIWSNIHFYTWDNGARVLRVKPALPLASPDTYTVLYSYVHITITTGNMASQNVVMAESMYPVLSQLLALRVTLSQTGDGNMQRAQSLLGMLNSTFAAKFGRAFMKNLGGDRDNVNSALVGAS